MATPRLLVVDDDPLMLEVVMLWAAAVGYNVHFARDGVEAVREVAAFAPDVMVLDVDMPNLDGFGVLQKLGPSKLSRLPTMMLTSRSHEEDVTRALDLGARDFLAKPVEHAVLLQRLKLLARADDLA